MSYANLDDLRALRPLRKSLMEFAKSASGKRVFLSHSHLDREALEGLLGLLDGADAPAYLDHEDDELPPEPNIETAQILRERIVGCPRFILASSSNIRSSRWTPWELGLADGLKAFVEVALFPLQPDAATSTSLEQEYLETYPTIEIVTFRGESNSTWAVRDPRQEQNTCWTLYDWLHNNIS